MNERIRPVPGAPTPLAACRGLDVPVLHTLGRRSTDSARGVGRLLASVLPRVRLGQFEHLGRMRPVTRPGVVDAAMEEFPAQL